MRPKLWEAANEITEARSHSLTDAVRQIILDLHPLVHQNSWIPLRDRLKTLDLLYAQEYRRTYKEAALVYDYVKRGEKDAEGHSDRFTELTGIIDFNVLTGTIRLDIS